MKKLVLMLAIVFSFGVSATYAVDVQNTKTEQVSTLNKDEKDKKEAKAEKKGDCASKSEKKCCSSKKACDDKDKE